MQPKNKGRKRILRTNASVSGPIKVRNLKTGELAIYTPDRLQPTIPAGWVPLNSNRQQPKTASRNFRRNSGLVVQTCGNQYRILNSSRKVVACGKLNASVEDDYWRSNLKNTWKNKASRWMDEDAFEELSEIFVKKTGWYPVDLDEYPDHVIATATPDGKGEKHLFVVTEETAGLGKDGEEFEDLGVVDSTNLDSSRPVVSRGKLNTGMHNDPRLTRNPDVDSVLDYYRWEIEDRDGRSYDWDDPDVDSVLDYYRWEIEDRDGRSYDWSERDDEYYDEEDAYYEDEAGDEDF